MNHVIFQLGHVFLESIKDAKDPIPQGPLYAAFMSQGLKLEHFNQLLSAFVALQAISITSELIYKGPTFDDVLSKFESLSK